MIDRIQLPPRFGLLLVSSGLFSDGLFWNDLFNVIGLP